MSTMSNGLRGITERPSTGELDYTELLKHFPANCPLVWELSPTREAAEIKESMKV